MAPIPPRVEVVEGPYCALFSPPPIRKTACKPNRPIKPCDLIVRFGLNSAERRCGALITALGMASGKASFMTESAVAPDAPDVAETVSFLRRFADLMANGYNGVYLRRAADLLETLTARVVSASGEEGLWRYKYEILTQHTDALETECEALRNDIEGHLEIASSLLAERDALGGTLQAREAELAVLREALTREHDERAGNAAAHEEALDGFRTAFDQQREALQATLEARVEECDQLRRELDRQRGDGEARPGAGAEPVPLRPLPNGQEAVGGETSAVVPITTLRQARAQFEYLAREFIPLGDIASQVMCELGAYTMDMALIGGQPNDHLPVGEVARSILAPVGLNRT